MPVTVYVQKFQRALADGNFLILDTETTGLRNAEICQIAIINQNGQTLIDTLVKPMASITPAAVAIHRITDDHVAYAPTWNEVQRQVADIVRDQQLVIYNAEFDAEIMTSAARHAGVTPSWNTAKGVWCAMRAFAHVYGDYDIHRRDYRWQRLTVAATSAGLQVQNAHSALGDCRMTLGVIKHILACN